MAVADEDEISALEIGKYKRGGQNDHHIGLARQKGRVDIFAAPDIGDCSLQPVLFEQLPLVGDPKRENIGRDVTLRNVQRLVLRLEEREGANSKCKLQNAKIEIFPVSILHVAICVLDFSFSSPVSARSLTH